MKCPVCKEGPLTRGQSGSRGYLRLYHLKCEHCSEMSQSYDNEDYHYAYTELSFEAWLHERWEIRIANLKSKMKL